MPIKVPDALPAVEVLNNENIFVMTENRALRQDIRPLRIAILNLMPIKVTTEIQLLRLLGNSPLQVEIDLLHTKTYKSKNTSEEYLATFYKTFSDVKKQKYDGMIITGAPIEHLEFEEVNYWDELVEIMEWSRKNVTSTLHICWAAQAGLYHHYGIPKYPLDKKMFGVFPHHATKKNVPLLRGFDDVFYAPHSRYTEIRKEDIEKIPELEVIAESDIAGIYIVKSEGKRQIFVTGHSEYDPLTLRDEYKRDIQKGIDIDVPENYFPNDDPSKKPVVNWRSHANLLFTNWLNYYVYQVTPYDINEIREPS